MLKNLTITFDELERRLFDTVASPSILGGPEQDAKGPYPWTRLVRRAAEGQALSAVELAALKKVLEDSVAERETNVASAREAQDEALASAFETWLDPLGEAWGLACQAEAVALGGDV
jgi:hypothetical protein